MAPSTSKFALIANPTAGKGVRRTQILVSALKARGIDLAWVSTEARDPIAATENAIRHGVDTVIAAGGDGTVSSVASVLASAGCRLAVLPTGTLNHFARDLGIPTQIEAALDVVATGREVRVDAADVNGVFFLNNSGLGIYPRMVITREKHRRLGRNRWVAMISAVARSLRSLPALGVRLHLDDKVVERITPVILIANNEYRMEGVAAGTRERLDTGQLFVYLANARTAPELVKLSFQALLGRLHNRPEFEMLSASEVVIETDRQQVGVSHDGQVTRMFTPLHYKILPAALRVLVP